MSTIDDYDVLEKDYRVPNNDNRLNKKPNL